MLDHIATDSTDAALRVLDRLIDVFELLAENPRAGHFRDDLTSRPVRFFPVYSYLVVYLDETDPIQVIRVLAAARDIGSIMSQDHA
jgi:plasmid stabilization system protein ParE